MTSTPLATVEALKNMNLGQLNTLLGWLDESPAYVEFCKEIRSEIDRKTEHKTAQNNLT